MLWIGRHAAPDHAAPPLIWPGMVTMPISRLYCLAIVLGFFMVGTAEAQSFGRWRMPSTPAQFFGYGYGPGHQAPMVRMPGCTPMSVQRLEVVSPPRRPRRSEYGCAAQSGMRGIAPGPQPCYGGGSGAMQPVQSCPCNHSQGLFSAPTNPMIPEPVFSTAPSEPTIEPLATPEN